MFDEVQFPPAISLGSTGGPERQTQIVIMGSGSEARNARWLNSRRSYDIGYGMHSDDDLWTVIAFFEARNAQLIGFRFKDWSDFKSCQPTKTVSFLDQSLGTGTGTLLSVQLTKKYQSGPSSWTRTILKPVAGTVQIGVNGVKSAPGDFSVDTTTGIVTFLTTPSPGAVLTAGFEFDTPVRFDTDKLMINMADYQAGKVQSIPLKELFDGT